MKKIFAAILSCMLLFCACAAGASSSNTSSGTEVSSSASSTDESSSAINAQTGDVIELSEKLFVAQTNDIYENTEDYIGKTIKYEGLVLSEYWDVTGLTYHYVIRYGPGCCGYDANCGFEISWDGEYPEDNEWVEAVGVLDTYEEEGVTILVLRLTSLTVLEERGQEYVTT